MSELEIGALVVVIIAICEAAKFAGLESRYIPALSVLLGLAGAIVWSGPSFITAAAGVVVGLATTGGYRLVKTGLLNK